MLSVCADEVELYWLNVGYSELAWVYFISLKIELLKIWDFRGFLPTNESDMGRFKPWAFYRQLGETLVGKIKK